VSRTVARDFSGRERFDWAELDRIRARWRGTLVLKGILDPDDARRARRAECRAPVRSARFGRACRRGCRQVVHRRAVWRPILASARPQSYAYGRGARRAAVFFWRPQP
jgi:hypothetical protein